MNKVPVEVSARHCHLSQADIDKLFGKGYQLKIYKKVSQPGQFATLEKIKLKGPKGSLALRIIAPARKQTQIELAITDCYNLGLKPVLKLSGNLNNSAGAVLIGPQGQIKLKQGVIVAQRHLHVSAKEAKNLKLKNGQKISVRIKGQRALIFNNVVVRAGQTHKKALQIDTDEGNACGWRPGLKAEILK
jgi:propanediol utilization protein